ncbi:MAG TPA: hypothetical protein VGH77_28600 [Streptosporangiaceae bacterium]
MLPLSSAARFRGVYRDVLAHRLQLFGERGERAEARSLAEGSAGLLQCVELFLDDLPGRVLVRQQEDGRAGDVEGRAGGLAGWDGPTGKAVSTGPRSRMTQFIRCLAVRARALSSAAVSPWWM